MLFGEKVFEMGSAATRFLKAGILAAQVDNLIIFFGEQAIFQFFCGGRGGNAGSRPGLLCWWEA